MLTSKDRMRIYFDYNATTPLLPAVAEAMTAAARDVFGNASSVHFFGQQAKAAVDGARSSVSALIGGDSAELVFTGGGTESDNFAIRGAAEALEQISHKIQALLVVERGQVVGIVNFHDLMRIGAF